ncbi:hypothetical protein SeMB42_g01182 [Synchytrium endobioticum]|uniref:Uncharacterized protein n=1 Tax=Synchytrium endobioticum TaxID=286115 RepID=A0A507DM74_9FUNG|nr:hypothetical protein SeLEV6574_g00743 [Synchytrium endobioticum]TPX52764.1 hypothetical protein SeMB42_g01182 [Synchytrium endobioticum]
MNTTTVFAAFFWSRTLCAAEFSYAKAPIRRSITTVPRSQSRAIAFAPTSHAVRTISSPTSTQNSTFPANQNREALSAHELQAVFKSKSASVAACQSVELRVDVPSESSASGVTDQVYHLKVDQLLDAVKMAPADKTLYTFRIDCSGSMNDFAKVIYHAPSKMGASWILNALENVKAEKDDAPPGDETSNEGASAVNAANPSASAGSKDDFKM